MSTTGTPQNCSWFKNLNLPITRDLQGFAERDRKLQEAREKRAQRRRLLPRGYQGQMALARTPAAG